MYNYDKHLPSSSSHLASITTISTALCSVTLFTSAEPLPPSSQVFNPPSRPTPVTQPPARDRVREPNQIPNLVPLLARPLKKPSAVYQAPPAHALVPASITVAVLTPVPSSFPIAVPAVVAVAVTVADAQSSIAPLSSYDTVPSTGLPANTTGSQIPCSQTGLHFSASRIGHPRERRTSQRP